MRIQISQQTTFRYEQPAKGLIQMLRLTPRNHNGQYVIDWRIDVSESCELRQHEDAFGNVTHVLTADGAIEELRILVDGEVETQDTHGVVTGAVERFPPRLFLRDTPLTQPDLAIVDFASKAWTAANGDVLGALHAMLDRLHEVMAFDPEMSVPAESAAAAFASKRGMAQDHAHVFIAAARSLGIPARFIGGHFYQAEQAEGQRAEHAWTEAFVSGLGWVAFDPVNAMCATDVHLRVAVGLDYQGAAPVRGSKLGGESETRNISIHVSQGASQSQE